MMKNYLLEICLPVAVASLAVAGIADMERPVRRDVGYFFDLASADTVIYVNDFGSADDTSFVAAQADTVKFIPARDTMVVPDSLRRIDPFRYKYYVALRDSLTHVIVRDSLKAAGDSLDWPKIDSIYRADSAARKKAEFLAWYNGLSKVERKKYDLNERLKVKKHISDSLMARQDSLKARRDSIIQATPRILETFALPDSLLYRRIIKWKHDRHFHDLEFVANDTTCDRVFYDYPNLRSDVNAVWLGLAGSASIPYNYFKRTDGDAAAFYEPFEQWSYNPSTLPNFNTKTPYTELAYYGTLLANEEKISNNLHILTTQNITPAFNFSLCYDRYGSNGMLDNEQTKNKTFYANANYLGKRYLLHAGYIYNMVSQEENGGIAETSWVRDTTVDARDIPIRMSNASSLIKKNTVFLDQQYRIPLSFFTDLLGKTKADTSAAQPLDLTRGTTAFIGHSSEYTVIRRTYTDEITSSDSDTLAAQFFNNTFNYNPTKSSDSLRVMRFDNKVFIRLQPWAADAVVSKLDVGAGFVMQSWYDFDPTFLYKQSNYTRNGAYIYGGAKGQVNKYVFWDAKADLFMTGERAGDFNVDANAGFAFYPFRRERKSPVSVSASFKTSLTEPDHYLQRIRLNHYSWDNSFDKISKTSLTGRISIPHWRMDATVGYGLLNNNIYFDTLGVVRQNSSAMSVVNASLSKDFTLAGFLHLNNRVLFQVSSNEDVLQLPKLAYNGRVYVEFDVKKNIMRMQLGTDILYTSAWYAPVWNPATSAFQVQNKEKFGDCPYFDAFVNIQWKRATVFIKLQNAGLGWPSDRADYFSSAGHITTQRALKLGVFWPFYTQTQKHVH